MGYITANKALGTDDASGLKREIRYAGFYFDEIRSQVTFYFNVNLVTESGYATSLGRVEVRKDATKFDALKSSDAAAEFNAVAQEDLDLINSYETLQNDLNPQE